MWKKVGYEYTKLTDNIVRAVEDTTSTVQPSVTVCVLRRYEIQKTEDLENVIDGWRLWTVTNPTSSAVTINISATEEAPAYVWSFTDASLNFTNCFYLTDKFNEIKFIHGGCGGSSNSTRHEDWVFFPVTVMDFNPLLDKVDDRLDNQ